MLRRAPLLFLLTMAFIACGSSVSSTGGDTTGGGGSGASGSGTGGSAAAGCPPSAPAEGAPCADASLACEYDDGPIVMCRAKMLCNGSTWFSEAPGCSSTPLGGDCPESPPQPGMCADDGLICLYDAGLHCGCSSCLGGPCGTEAMWVCAEPPSGGCPAEAPLLGQPCGDEALECSYGSCALGTQAQRSCSGGVWKDVPVPCPV